MSRQLVPEEVSQIVQRINPDVQLCVEEGVAIEVAPSLRQLSRELRATSQSLRLRNVEVINQANAVAVRCYDLYVTEPELR